MASDNPVVSTPFGQVSQVTEGAGQTMVHTVANWMWLPMILMGAMAIAAAVGLGIAQAQVASDLGEEFSALRKANFETLKPLTGGFVFLGLALILSGIAFLLATILGALRWGGGEVQEALDQPVMALIMPWSAKLFLALMMAGLMTELLAFCTLIFVSTEAHSAWIGASAVDAPGNVDALQQAGAYAAWANPLRLAAVGLILSGIVFALITISNVLGAMLMRVRVMIAIVGQPAGGSQ